MKDFWKFFCAAILAIACYSFTTAYVSSHVLVVGAGNGVGGSYVINRVAGPWTNPSDVYSVYMIPVTNVENGTGGWNLQDGKDEVVQILDKSLRGRDGSDTVGGSANEDNVISTDVIYVVVCAPSGLSTYAEVQQYSWNIDGDKKGPRHNYIGYNFNDMGSGPHLQVLRCGR